HEGAEPSNLRLRRQVMSVIDTRRQQMFPVLDAGQIETASRFASGPARDFAPNEIVFAVGERRAPSWLVLKGSINTLTRDGINREAGISPNTPGTLFRRL